MIYLTSLGMTLSISSHITPLTNSEDKVSICLLLPTCISPAKQYSNKKY